MKTTVLIIVSVFILIVLFYFADMTDISKTEYRKDAKCIMTFGDSITLGIGRGIGNQETYTFYTESLFRKSGKKVKIIRSGISGETADGALLRVEKDIVKLRPDHVLIMYGTNDAFVDTCYDVSDISPRLPINVYRNSMETIVKILLKADINPVLMTPIMMGDFECTQYGVYKEKGVNFMLSQYASVVRKIASDYGLTLVDHFKHWEQLKKKGIDINRWLIDGVHPNREGHQYIAETIYKTLRNKL